MSFFKSILAHSPVLFIIAVFAGVPPFVTNMYYLQVLVFIGIYMILALSPNLVTKLA